MLTPSFGKTNSTGEPLALARIAMKSTIMPYSFSPLATRFSVRPLPPAADACCAARPL